MYHQQPPDRLADKSILDNKIEESPLRSLTGTNEPSKAILAQPRQSNSESEHETPSTLKPEEAKLEIEIKQPNEDIVWEWKCNLDPCSGEPGQWMPYKPAERDLLEKAYQSQSQQVILEEWIVHISDKHMFQQRKDNASLQRLVRRTKKNATEKTKENKEEFSRIQRFVGGETPKTYTTAFGSLDDYLAFFENRTSEMVSFADLFKNAEASGEIDKLNEDIVLAVIDCIRKRASKHNKISDQEILLSVFEKRFVSFEELYGAILMAYTLETFLYQKINEYLRTEGWTQLDDLLPYAFCLCKAFQCSNLTSTCNKSLKQSRKNDLILYRGAQFDEASLNCYTPDRVSTFSWNAVTSTSTNPKIAKMFSKITKGSNMIPVIFIIEVSTMTQNDLKDINLIDIKMHSAMEDEEEIVLAPGSIFELVSFTRDQEGAEIKLRLVSDTSILALQGKIMPGAMHVQVSKGKIARVICEEGRELAEALYHLRGNQMIEEIEFRLCKFNKNTLELLDEILPTLSRLTKVTLFYLSSDRNTHLESILKTIRNLEISSIELLDQLFGEQIQFRLFLKELAQLATLSNLKIDLRKGQNIDDTILKALGAEGIRYLTSLTTFTLDCTLCQQITDKGLETLCSEGLKYLTSLTTLTLEMSYCNDITDKGVKKLFSEGLKYLTSLTKLTLNLSYSQITNEGMKSICSEGLKYLTSLTTLTLAYEKSNSMTDEGLENLCSEGLKYLTSLTTLTLNLKEWKITDEGMKSLSRALRCLTSLTTMTLDFSSNDITDEGMKSLCSEGLKYLTSLTTLILALKSYTITSEGVRSLCSEEIIFLPSLASLTLETKWLQPATYEGINYLAAQVHRLRPSLILSFQTSIPIRNLSLKRDLVANSQKLETRNESHALLLDSTLKISDFYTNYIETDKWKLIKSLRVNYKSLENELLVKEMEDLYLKSLKNMTALTTLTLEINWCQFVTDEGLIKLCSVGLKYLTSLTTLTVEMRDCYNITDQGLKSLYSEGFKYLASLTTLTLIFDNCGEITDDGLKSLCSEGLEYLTSLTTLKLEIKQFYHTTTDGGLKNLLLYGLRYLTSLTTLTLYFTECKMKSLPSEGFRHLTSLKTLSLEFESCEEMSDEGMKSLGSEILKYLTSLMTLKLNFGFSPEITDEGVKNLCTEGFRDLSSLTTLSLNFGDNKITDEGIKSLCSEGFRYLTSLANLALGVHLCSQITDEGMKSLCSGGLRHLPSLTNLNLKCFNTSDEGMKILSAEGLRYLTSLTDLTLDFFNSKKITEEGMKSFSSGLRYLTSLMTLRLDFFDYDNLSDEGLKSLCSEGLKYLTSLKTLTLNFEHCKISDKEIMTLSSEGLKYLPSLNINVIF